MKTKEEYIFMYIHMCQEVCLSNVLYNTYNTSNNRLIIPTNALT